MFQSNIDVFITELIRINTTNMEGCYVKKLTTIFIIILTIGLFCLSFTGCSSSAETAIKAKCEEVLTSTMESTNKEWERNGFTCKQSSPKATIEYDKETNKFTYTFSYSSTISYILEPSDPITFDTSGILYGHMNGDTVVIDNVKMN